MTPGGPTPTITTVRDVYQAGRIAYQTDGTGTTLATFSYDSKEQVQYDAETDLYWLSVRAYDPTLGRFLSRDPLGRAPLFGPETQPYVYAGNNPLTNVDPSGQMFYMGDFGGGLPDPTPTSTPPSGAQTTPGANPAGGNPQPTYACNNSCLAEQFAYGGGRMFTFIAGLAAVAGFITGALVAAYTGGLGLFIGGVIAGALVSIAFSAGLAAYDFSTFDKDLAKVPAYLKNFRNTIHNGIGLTATVVFTLGMGLQAITGRSISALMANGQRFVEALAAGSAWAVGWTGAGVGLMLGAVASLLILNPLADRYLDPIDQLETGSLQQCGNNTTRIEDPILCPTTS